MERNRSGVFSLFGMKKLFLTILTDRRKDVSAVFASWKGRIDAIKQSLAPKKEPAGEEADSPISPSLNETLVSIRTRFQNSSDLLVRELPLGGVKTALVMAEGLISQQTLSEVLLEPLLSHRFSRSAGTEEVRDFVENKSILAADMLPVYSYNELFRFIMSGFVVILIDGAPRGTACGIQGYPYRSISEPTAEVNERGSKEGFTEPIRTNMSLVRRRVKSPLLKFELFPVGKISRTDICLIYMTDRVSAKLLREVRRKINSIDLDVILTAGYLQPFLTGRPWSLFSDVGTTERPDVLAAKVQEGRIAILVDGTPFALIVPYLFTENFQTLDDYAHSAFYASFIRIIRYFSFIISILLPGAYVAISTFHPELLPQALLFNIAAAEDTTPFPLGIEALIIHLLYEIMREAGLRLPRPVGHAVSIVGALVIGDAAVTAGLIGAPMIMIVATTAIASFVVPSLYEPVSVLRFAYILVGMMLGLYGITLLSLLLLINICTLQNFGQPYTAPVAPFSSGAMRDTFIRLSFRTLQKHTATLQELNGSHLSEKDQEGSS